MDYGGRTTTLGRCCSYIYVQNPRPHGTLSSEMQRNRPGTVQSQVSKITDRQLDLGAGSKIQLSTGGGAS